MNNFGKFEKIAIRWIVLFTFRTTGPRCSPLHYHYIDNYPDYHNTELRSLTGPV